MSYRIVPYKSIWRTQFIEIGNILRQSLGELSIRIDHIGSTAITGLAAKDLIDVQITVQSLTADVEAALNQAEYTRLEHITQDHIPPGYSPNIEEWTKWFFKPSGPDPAVNIHMRLEGRANQRYPLLFRDYLRAHPEIAEAYGQVKLAQVPQSLAKFGPY